MTNDPPAAALEIRRAAAEAFYGPLAASPDPARRVGWDHAVAHGLRLAAIADAAVELGAADVIDAGCGEGALLPVLRRAGFTGAYRGEDVLVAMIGRARAALGAEVELVVADAFAGGPSADVVVCSGALNTAIAGVDPDAEAARAITALWSRSRRGVVLDLAVADRHPEGVGLARVDLARAWGVARTLAPVVLVREDVVPGEALLVLSRSRAPAWRRWVPDPLARAHLLLDAGEADGATACIDHMTGQGERAEAIVVRGRAAALSGALDAAIVLFGEAIERGERAVRARAGLALAPLLFRRGRKAEAEATLSRLADEGSDEARAHLVMMYLGRREHERARGAAATIVDPWIRREIEAQVAKSAGPA